MDLKIHSVIHTIIGQLINVELKDDYCVVHRIVWFLFPNIEASTFIEYSSLLSCTLFDKLCLIMCTNNVYINDAITSLQCGYKCLVINCRIVQQILLRSQHRGFCWSCVATMARDLEILLCQSLVVVLDGCVRVFYKRGCKSLYMLV